MSTYAKLVRLLWDATKELNLQSLTESDRMIYMLLVETSKKGLTKVTYDELNELISEEGLVISRAQLIKTRKKIFLFSAENLLTVFFARTYINAAFY